MSASEVAIRHTNNLAQHAVWFQRVQPQRVMLPEHLRIATEKVACEQIVPVPLPQVPRPAIFPEGAHSVSQLHKRKTSGDNGRTAKRQHGTPPLNELVHSDDEAFFVDDSIEDGNVFVNIPGPERSDIRQSTMKQIIELYEARERLYADTLQQTLETLRGLLPPTILDSHEKNMASLQTQLSSSSLQLTQLRQNLSCCNATHTISTKADARCLPYTPRELLNSSESAQMQSVSLSESIHLGGKNIDEVQATAREAVRDIPGVEANTLDGLELDALLAEEEECVITGESQTVPSSVGIQRDTITTSSGSKTNSSSNQDNYFDAEDIFDDFGEADVSNSAGQDLGSNSIGKDEFPDCIVLTDSEDDMVEDVVARPPLAVLSDNGNLERNSKVGNANRSRSSQLLSEKLPDLSQQEMQYAWSADVTRALTQTFGLQGFRNNQLEAINATLGGKDVFILMPTGGGKSLCYQLPAVVDSGSTRGLTLVISPLISLMQDQLQHLQQRRIAAAIINSEQSADERRAVFADLASSNCSLKLLYVTPELLEKSQQMIRALEWLHKRERLARIVIDEAHCVSQWGHDFRPDYTQLGKMKQMFPHIPLMALTATATEVVRMDVVSSLRIDGCVHFEQSFNRPNLYYAVRKKDASFFTEVSNFIKQKHRGKSGIIYCLSRNNCEQVAAKLTKEYGLLAHHYHAGMDKVERARVQADWQKGRFNIIVATIAFGMGIDKSDVRFVIHQSLPKSLEGYYQETGRAGRDGLLSDCILYFGYRDKQTLESLIDKGDGTHEQKQRQKASVRQVISYCENEVECRRKQVLGYFHEVFDPANCRQGCDNCRSDTVYDMRDVTDYAKLAVNLIQGLDNGNWTLLQAAEMLRGSKSTKFSKEGANYVDGFGGISDWSRADIERLLHHMIHEGFLTERSKSNRMGFATAYVKLGRAPDYRALLTGKKRLVMAFKQAGQRKQPQSRAAYDKPAQANGREDLDLGPIRIGGTNAAAQNSGSRQQSTIHHRIDLGQLGSQGEITPLEAELRSGFLVEAIAKRSKLAEENDINRVTSIFTDEQLGVIAKHLPKNVEGLVKLPGMDSTRARRYAGDFMPLIRKYIKKKAGSLDQDDDIEATPSQKRTSRFFRATSLPSPNPVAQTRAAGSPQKTRGGRNASSRGGRGRARGSSGSKGSSTSALPASRNSSANQNPREGFHTPETTSRPSMIRSMPRAF